MKIQILQNDSLPWKVLWNLFLLFYFCRLICFSVVWWFVCFLFVHKSYFLEKSNFSVHSVSFTAMSSNLHDALKMGIVYVWWTQREKKLRNEANVWKFINEDKIWSYCIFSFIFSLCECSFVNSTNSLWNHYLLN